MTTPAEQHRTPLGLFADKPMLRLYDRNVEVLRVRHYSRRTEEAYLNWIRRYIEFVGLPTLWLAGSMSARLKQPITHEVACQTRKT